MPKKKKSRKSKSPERPLKSQRWLYAVYEDYTLPKKVAQNQKALVQLIRDVERVSDILRSFAKGKRRRVRTVEPREQKLVAVLSTANVKPERVQVRAYKREGITVYYTKVAKRSPKKPKKKASGGKKKGKS